LAEASEAAAFTGFTRCFFAEADAFARCFLAEGDFVELLDLGEL